MKMKKRIKNTLEFIGLLMYQSRLIQTMFFVSLYEFDTKNILLQKKKKNREIIAKMYSLPVSPTVRNIIIMKEFFSNFIYCW